MTREIGFRTDLASSIQLRRLIRQIRPDVIHLHSSKAGALGRVAAWGLGVTRVVYQPHGLSFLRTDVSAGRRRLFFAIEWMLARLPCTIVACSMGELKQVRQLGGGKAVLVPNGMDLDMVAGLVANPGDALRPGRLRVGTCGRLSPQKDPLFFNDVATALRQSADFVWIGDGEAEYKEALGEAGVEVTGWQSRADVLRLMSQLDVYLQTSAWEGMPISVIEALALGLPVIATDILGNRDIVDGSGAGRLVTTRDAMIRELDALLKDGGQRAAMSLRGRQHALERFSASAMCAAMQALYEGKSRPLSLTAS